jgi:hypothetical protein
MGNESESPSSAQNDFVNGAIAASYNWLKVEDQQQQMQASDGLESSYFNFQPTTLNIPGSVTSFNSDQQQQQQINSILNSALVASASMLSRKMSWEINSPDESPREKNNQKQQQSHHYPQNNEIEVIAEKNKGKKRIDRRDIFRQHHYPLFTFPNLDKDTDGQIPNADLLQSIIASSLPSAPATIRPKLERTETRPSVSSGVITSTSAAPPPLRKRRHSSSSAPAHSIEDEIQEAKLQHILLQVKREEILLKQEKARLLQEEAKLRQEQIKLELLERQLKTNSSNYKSTADTQRDI